MLELVNSFWVQYVGFGGDLLAEIEYTINN